MPKMIHAAATIVALALLPASAMAQSSKAASSSGAHDSHGAHAGHRHAKAFSAGEPGDPKKPSRTVEVSMGESDGKMFFAPAKLAVKKGEQIKFVLRNGGELEHEFVLASTADNLKHAAEMAKSPDAHHDEANGKELDAKASGDFLWRFTKAGDFEYACLIPGHREAGMIGIVSVK